MVITRRETPGEYFQFLKEFTLKSVTPLDILSIYVTKDDTIIYKISSMQMPA
jgi:hypothetical protein